MALLYLDMPVSQQEQYLGLAAVTQLNGTEP